MTTDHDIDTDVMIPRSRRVKCEMCGDTLDRNAPGVYQYIAGWAKNRKAGGSNAVALAERSNRYACPVCVDCITHGIPIGQTRLF